MTSQLNTRPEATTHPTGITLTSGTVLNPDGAFSDRDLHLQGGLVSDEAAPVSTRIDVAGCLVLPGIVDAHGDGFEHHLMPRIGTDFPEWIALRNVDRELLANGISTAFLAQSYSWEGGMRGVEAARALIDGLRTLDPAPGADMRFQIRYETFFLEGADQLLAWLEEGLIKYVVFNNHVPQYQELIDAPENVERWAGSVGLTPDAFRALLQKTVEDGIGVLDAVARLAEAMTRLGVPFGSHDDPDPETRRQYNDVGAYVAEFPLTVAAAETARALGNPIMMGAPNALRGKSQSGNVSARALISLGLCDALVSDYYYPALLQAPFALVRDGVTDLARAWQLVSSGPANALGLSDRGALAPGKRGDVTVLRQDAAGRPHVLATFVAGQPAFLDPELAAMAMRPTRHETA